MLISASSSLRSYTSLRDSACCRIAINWTDLLLLPVWTFLFKQGEITKTTVSVSHIFLYAQHKHRFFWNIPYMPRFVFREKMKKKTHPPTHPSITYRRLDTWVHGTVPRIDRNQSGLLLEQHRVGGLMLDGCLFRFIQKTRSGVSQLEVQVIS